MSSYLEDALCVACKSNRLRRRFPGPRYNIYACSDCGLSFLFPTAPNLVDIYQKDFYHEDPVLHRSLKEQIQRGIKPILPKGRILDIGAGAGEFLKLCKDFGYEAQGIDFSPWAVEICQRVGLIVQAGNLPDMDYPREYFDCVTMWDVIEHLKEPDVYLQSAWRVLKDEGWLILKTPNVTQAIFLLARGMGKAGSSPEAIFGLPAHILYFDYSSLTKLLRLNGFLPRRVLLLGRMRTRPKPRTWKGVVYQSIWDCLSTLGLAGNLVVYAQKSNDI